MQLYLFKPFKTTLNEFISVEFTGSKLRVIFNGKVVTDKNATAGECFYVQPNGQKKQPTITKASMPSSRGAKIMWALDFIQSQKQASSFKDFKKQFSKATQNFSEEDIFYSISKDRYAFVLGKQTTKNGVKFKPLLAWVADDLEPLEMNHLISDYTQYKKIHCGEGFLRVL